MSPIGLYAHRNTTACLSVLRLPFRCRALGAPLSVAGYGAALEVGQLANDWGASTRAV
jgi:hypothetical protein